MGIVINCDLGNGPHDPGIPKSYFLSDRIGKHPEKSINKRSAANLSRLLELEKRPASVHDKQRPGRFTDCTLTCPFDFVSEILELVEDVALAFVILSFLSPTDKTIYT